MQGRERPESRIASQARRQLRRIRRVQVPIRDIAELTGLELDQLVAVDRMPIAATLGTAGVGATWRKLNAVEDLDLDFDLKD